MNDPQVFGNRIWTLCGGPQASARHKIGSLLHALGSNAVPQEMRARFKADFYQTLAENLRFLKETKDVLAVLGGRLPVMPLKGVLFEAQFYPGMGCRPQSDVDVLVRQSDIEEAHGLLIGAGWREAVPRKFYSGHYHWVYEKADGSGTLLELHWSLKFPGTISPDIGRIWANAVEREIEGARALVMSAEDLIEYMAVNKGMQHYPTLLDFVDLHFIVERGELDWGKILRNVAEDNTAGPLWFGLFHCKEFLATSVPDRVLARLRRMPSCRGARLLKRVIGPAGGVLNIPEALLEGPTGRLYEAFLEGQPRAIVNLFLPLLFPSEGRVEVLTGGGSYLKYYWRGFSHLAHQLKKSTSVVG